MLVRRGLLIAAALAAIFAGPSLAAPARTVTITVRDSAGVPVPRARVLVSADEMDAVGITDDAGQVRVSTVSARIVVTADKGGRQTTTSSSASQVGITLAGGAQ